jgi:hypothetical protein
MVGSSRWVDGVAMGLADGQTWQACGQVVPVVPTNEVLASAPGVGLRKPVSLDSTAWMFVSPLLVMKSTSSQMSQISRRAGLAEALVIGHGDPHQVGRHVIVGHHDGLAVAADGAHDDPCRWSVPHGRSTTVGSPHLRTRR